MFSFIYYTYIPTNYSTRIRKQIDSTALKLRMLPIEWYII